MGVRHEYCPPSPSTVETPPGPPDPAQVAPEGQKAEDGTIGGQSPRSSMRLTRMRLAPMDAAVEIQSKWIWVAVNS